MKKVIVLLLIVLPIKLVSQSCNSNSLYDAIVSAYHQSVAQKSDGSWSGWGALMSNSGGSVLSPQDINSTNYPNLTGIPLLASTASAGSGSSEQSVLLTTTGLFAWGTEGVSIPNAITTSATFQKLTINSKTDGLPTGVVPTDVVSLVAINNAVIIVTSSGSAYVIIASTNNSSSKYSGDGSTTVNQIWHQVKINASTNLTNVIALRGQISSDTKGGFMALTYDGSVYKAFTWGNSVYLGNNTVSAAYGFATEMTLPSGITPKMIAITGGSTPTGNSCFLLATDGQLFALGSNNVKQLGDFTTTERKVWVNSKVNATTNFTNIKYISAQEHDSKFAAVGAITNPGVLYMWGQNGGNMLGYVTDGAALDPLIPGGFTVGSDIAKLVEIGGHTSTYIKENSAKFCYVGHKTAGSMGDGTNDDTNPYLFDCDATPVINICGSTGWDYGDAPIHYENGGGSNFAQHFYVQNATTLFLGSLTPSSNDDTTKSVIVGTDNTGTNGDGIEEDGVSNLSPLSNSATSYTIPVSVFNNTGVSANLYVWVDWNNNGKFEATEFKSSVVTSSSTQQSKSINYTSLSGLSDGRRYMRIRLSTFSLTDNTSTTAVDERSLGFLGDGEIEDHAIVIGSLYSGNNIPPVSIDVSNSTQINYNSGIVDLDDLQSTDADGIVVAYRIKSLPTKGTLFKLDGLTAIPVVLNEPLTVASTNSIKYTPDGVSAGTDLFTFAAIDDDGAEDLTPANFTINIYNPNVPSLNNSSSFSNFVACSGNISSVQTFTVSGTNLTNNVVVTAPTGFEVSLNNATGFGSTATITASGTLSATNVYIRMAATATGNPTGNITIASTGTTDQTIAVSGNVTAATSAGTLSGTQAICVGNTTTFSSSVSGGIWTSSDTTIATVNTSGVITGVTAGTATITYTVSGSGGCADATATRSVTITTAPSAGTLSGTQAICVGNTTTYTSSVNGGAWTSSNTAVATVNASGVITGVTAGTATITYTVTGTDGCADATATRSVTVSALPPISITQTNPSVCQGGDIILEAVSSAASQIYGSGFGTNPNISAAVDQNWEVVALPQTFYNSATFSAMNVTLPYSAKVISGADLPSIFAYRNGFNDGSNTYYWIAPYANATSLQGGSYNWIVRQEFQVSSSGTYNFSFTGAGDNDISFFVDGTINSTNPELPTITGGTQIGNTHTTFTSTGTMTGSVYLTPGTHYAYMVMQDYGGLTCALISGANISSQNTFSWAYQTASQSGFTPISNSNSATYSATNITETTTYQVTVSDGSCTNTTQVTVTANPLPNPPTALAVQQICPGNTIANLQASTTVGNTIEWYAAVTGGSALNIATALVEGTTYYAQAVNANGCGSSRVAVEVVYNNALDFDGTNDYVSVGDIIENLADVTMEAWVYWKGSSLAHSEIFTKDVISSMAITSANKLHSNFGNGSSWIAGLDSQTAIPLNKWTHVAITRQSGVVKMYINGVEDAATVLNNATGQNAEPRIIGGKMVASSTTNTLFNGSIDEIRFWSVAKTAAQINSNLSTQYFGNETNLVAYYNFNQGIQNGNNTGITSLTNSVSSTNNGTITSFALNGTTSNFVPGYFPEITGNSSVLAGSTVQLSNPQTGGTWSSSSGAIATVNSSGLVTGVSAGTVTITYSYCGQSTSYSVTVNSAAALTVISTGITSFSSCLGFVSPAQSITVSGANLTANVTVTAPTGYEVSTSVASGYASSITITASGTLNATTVYIRLSSSASVGSVNGTLTITSTDATTQSVSLTGAVTAAPSAGTLSGTQAICVGNTTTFSSSVSGGAWTSSDTTIATVNTSGVITGVASGTTTITYTVAGTGGCADATATRTVIITAAPSAGTLSGIQSVLVGGTTTFTSTVSGGAWTSSNTAVASVNASGVIIGVATGTATITYTVTGTGGCADAAATRTVVVSSVINAVNDTPVAISAGDSTPSVITNDTLDGSPVVIGTNPGQVTLTGVTVPTGLTLNVNGTITVGAALSSGTYTLTYQICENGSNPVNCDTATATIIVTNVIDAVNDTPVAITAGDSSPSVITNDTLDGSPVVIGTNPGQVTLTGVTVPTGLTLNGNGTITVGAGLPSGTYSLTYQICENGANPVNCDTATVTIIVTNVIDAVNDTTAAINGVIGGTTQTVIMNDTLDGSPVVIGTNPGQVTLTGVTVPTGLTLNANGTITVGAGFPSGTYSVIYTICENSATPANCDTATALVTIGLCTDFPINDCDGDGVTNGQELLNGTNPSDPCSFVLAHQTVIPTSTWNNLDCDNDGLTNGEEIAIGTNSLNADSDGDGVLDGTEIDDDTDPTNPCEADMSHSTLELSQDFLEGDCDGDGLSNGEEIGPNPNLPFDPNGNGIPDYLEPNDHSPRDFDFDIEVFNLVTPNGDGDNDVFVIRNIEMYPDNSVEIYNRWGVKVFGVEGYGQSGKFFRGISEGRATISQNSELPVGTYWYIIKYKTAQGVWKQRVGYLYLNK